MLLKEAPEVLLEAVQESLVDLSYHWISFCTFSQRMNDVL